MGSFLVDSKGFWPWKESSSFALNKNKKVVEEEKNKGLEPFLKRSVHGERIKMVERIYTVPLRSEWLKVPKWRRSKRASAALRAFLLRHTKAKEVKLSRWVNEEIWESGGKNPPPRIKVKVTKEEDIARVELLELPPRALRIAEAEKKKVKEKAKAEKDEKKKLEEEYKKKRKEEKEKLEKLKEQAKVTKAQEASLHK